MNGYLFQLRQIIKNIEQDSSFFDAGKINQVKFIQNKSQNIEHVKNCLKNIEKYCSSQYSYLPENIINMMGVLAVDGDLFCQMNNEEIPHYEIENIFTSLVMDTWKSIPDPYDGWMELRESKLWTMYKK